MAFKEKFEDIEEWGKGKKDLEEVDNDMEEDLFKDADLLNKNDLKRQKLELDNFWDQDIKIKNKRYSKEDFNRYKIKDWDIDRKIEKMFGDVERKK